MLERRTASSSARRGASRSRSAPTSPPRVAWSAAVSEAGRVVFQVRTATSDRRGAFGPGRRLSPERWAAWARVATSPSGVTTVLYTQVTEGTQPSVMAASTRPAGGSAFGAPETVSAGAASTDARPALAMDPRDGRLLAAWLGAPGTGVLTSSRPPA